MIPNRPGKAPLLIKFVSWRQDSPYAEGYAAGYRAGIRAMQDAAEKECTDGDEWIIGVSQLRAVARRLLTEGKGGKK
jgi:hypothetical protein